ncbi:hypothetical protein CHS0354_005028 [Potamilus streckersoni]|uniref:Uncharacterized protein n=1 Tax=Potamilus streckersoni TaxID=2493646 RepID=A0AAE0W0A4_9BIVA|nr:hypothetical protein CHS0354_005028 [Potamilus streckersoni]
MQWTENNELQVLVNIDTIEAKSKYRNRYEKPLQEYQRRKCTQALEYFTSVPVQRKPVYTAVIKQSVNSVPVLRKLVYTAVIKRSVTKHKQNIITTRSMNRNSTYNFHAHLTTTSLLE